MYIFFVCPVLLCVGSKRSLNITTILHFPAILGNFSRFCPRVFAFISEQILILLRQIQALIDYLDVELLFSQYLSHSLRCHLVK